MPEYAYEALDERGVVTRGETTAASEFELESRLRSDGQFLIRAEPRPPATSTAPAGRATAPRPRTGGAVNRKDILAFTEYLFGATHAGIPILTTLDDVVAQLESRKMREITRDIHRSMSVEGLTLSEAMALHPNAFPEVYLATVKAGEMTGQLDYALQQLVDYLEWNRDITLQVRQATLYPIIVLLLMGALIVLLLMFVYPRLLPVFTSFDIELPWPTRLVMGLGSFLQAHWVILLVALVVAIIAFRIFVATPGGRLTVDSLKLRLPIFGKLLLELEMARLVTYMGLFYRTGVDLLLGLSLIEQMLTNRRLAVAVGDVRSRIAGGESMALALTSTDLFPTIVVRSFALGEATGRLDESLERARVYYAREVPAAVRRMLTALQPALIVFMGSVIGIVMMSIFLPILRIYQAVGQ